MKAKAAASPSSRRPKAAGDQFAHLSEEDRAALKDLAEVERAIAALEGRSDASPEDLAFARREAERMRRELAAAIERTEQNIRAARRARVVRAVSIVAVIAAVAGAAALGGPVVRRVVAERAAADEAADKAAAPFAAEGFSEIEASAGLGARVVTGERGRCFIAVAASARGAARVRVERDMASAEGRSAAFCTCGLEQARVTPIGEEPLSLRILSAPASIAGGADLLGILPTPPEARIPEILNRSCAEEAIDELLAARPLVADAPDDAPVPEMERMDALGFGLVAKAPAGRPIVGVPLQKGACFVALGDAGDALTLRLRGGGRPLQARRAPIAFCGAAVSGASVWREGAGVLRLFAMPAERAGGLLGLRELTARLGRPADLWVGREDLAFDARSALLSSGLSPSDAEAAEIDPAEEPPGGERAVPVDLGRENVFSKPSGPPDPTSFASVSTDERSLLTVPASAPGVLCRPPVDVGVARSLCLLLRPEALGEPEGMPPGAVAAKRPFWLPIARGNRAQNERALDVLAFARRMSAAGFELTALTGFVEVPGGVQVTGRSAEREVVAISLTARSPYVHTLSDGPAWKLDGAPRVVPLSAGATVRLVPTPRFLGPRSGRETVIWRR